MTTDPRIIETASLLPPALRAQLVGLWRFRIPAHFNDRVVTPDATVIHLVESGCYTVSISGRAWEVTPGDVIWYQPREAVAWTGGTTPVGFYSCAILLPELTPPERRVQSAPPVLRPVFHALWKSANGHGMSAFTGLMRHVADFIDVLLPLAGTNMDNPWRRAECWASSHHRLHATLTELAASVHTSPSTLTRSCRTLYGISPGARLRRLKMEKARTLIEQTPMRIADIAKQTGYRAPQDFTRAFVACFGRTPMEWRQHRQGVVMDPDGRKN